MPRVMIFGTLLFILAACSSLPKGNVHLGVLPAPCQSNGHGSLKVSGWETGQYNLFISCDGGRTYGKANDRIITESEVEIPDLIPGKSYTFKLTKLMMSNGKMVESRPASPWALMAQ